MEFDLRQQYALSLWSGALGDSVRSDDPDLSARQMAILLSVYMDAPPHTVRGLASALKISKPAVTRALHKLVALGLARRKKDESDRRSVLVQRTVKGAVFLADFAERIAGAGRERKPVADA